MSRTFSLDGIPNDILSSDSIGVRRFKTSSEDSKANATMDGLLYSFTGSYSIVSGQSLALNIKFSAPSIIHSITSNNGLRVALYNDSAAGEADGILSPVNNNLYSIDQTTATSQLFYNSTASGELVALGYGSINPFTIADYNSDPSVVVANDTGSTLTIFISVVFEEFGERSGALGLTPSTFLESTSEMSHYG